MTKWQEHRSKCWYNFMSNCLKKIIFTNIYTISLVIENGEKIQNISNFDWEVVCQFQFLLHDLLFVNKNKNFHFEFGFGFWILDRNWYLNNCNNVIPQVWPNEKSKRLQSLWYRYSRRGKIFSRNGLRPINICLLNLKKMVDLFR